MEKQECLKKVLYIHAEHEFCVNNKIFSVLIHEVLDVTIEMASLVSVIFCKFLVTGNVYSIFEEMYAVRPRHHQLVEYLEIFAGFMQYETLLKVASRLRTWFMCLHPVDLKIAVAELSFLMNDTSNFLETFCWGGEVACYYANDMEYCAGVCVYPGVPRNRTLQNTSREEFLHGLVEKGFFLHLRELNKKSGSDFCNIVLGGNFLDFTEHDHIGENVYEFDLYLIGAWNERGVYNTVMRIFAQLEGIFFVVEELFFFFFLIFF